MKLHIEKITETIEALNSVPAGERTEDFQAALGGLRMAVERLTSHVPALEKKKKAAVAEADALEKRAKELREGTTAPLATQPAGTAGK
jgi:chromosome segregation ATPase